MRTSKLKLLRVDKRNRVGASLTGDAMTAALLVARRIEKMTGHGWGGPSKSPSRGTILLFADNDGALYITRDNSELAQDVVTHYPRWPVGFYAIDTRARVIAEDIAHEAGLRAMRPQTKAGAT